MDLTGKTYYKIGWDISTTGSPQPPCYRCDPWTGYRQLYDQGSGRAFGAGIRFADFDANGQLDAVTVIGTTCSQGGNTYDWATMRFGWDISSTGWFAGTSKPFFVSKDGFWGGAGFGVAVMYLNSPIPDAVFQAMFALPFEDENRFIWG